MALWPSLVSLSLGVDLRSRAIVSSVVSVAFEPIQLSRNSRLKYVINHVLSDQHKPFSFSLF